LVKESLQDEIKEFKEDLSDIDKLFYDTALSTNKLNKGLSSTQKILDSKVWTVVSRVTSGGAFWRFQNRVRAVIETANMLTSLSARKAKREAEMMRETAKLAKQYEKLIKIQEFFEKDSPLDDEMKKKIQETDVYYATLLGFYKQGLSQEEATQRAMEKTLKIIKDRLKQEGILNKIKKDTAKTPFFERTKTLKNIKTAFSDAYQATLGKAFEETDKMKGKITGFIPKQLSDISRGLSGEFSKTPDGKKISKQFGKGSKLTKMQKLAAEYYEKNPERTEKLVEFARTTNTLIRPITKGVKTLVFFVTTIIVSLILLASGLRILYEVSQQYGTEISNGLSAFYDVFMYGFELMNSGLGNIISGVTNLGTGFYDILNGDFYTGITTILTGGWEIILGALQILGGLLIVSFGAIIAGLGQTIWDVGSRGSGLILEKIGNVQSFVGKIILGIALVAAAISLVVAGTIAAPIIVAAAIGLALIAIGKLFMTFGSTIEDGILFVAESIAGLFISFNLARLELQKFILDSIINYITWYIKNVVKVMTLLWNVAIATKNAIIVFVSSIPSLIFGLGQTISGIAQTIIDGIIGGITYLFVELPSQMATQLAAIMPSVDVPDFGLGGITEYFASGGVVNSPYQVVGEEGPELVKLPRGSRVFSNNQSRTMLSGSTNNITVQVSGRVGASDSEIRDIARKVAKEINTQMNRTSSTVVRI
jgi:hypothetical protein